MVVDQNIVMCFDTICISMSRDFSVHLLADNLSYNQVHGKCICVVFKDYNNNFDWIQLGPKKSAEERRDESTHRHSNPH